MEIRTNICIRYINIPLRTTMDNQADRSRPYRLIAPRQVDVQQPQTPQAFSADEGKTKRASMACTECKKRRTKVRLLFSFRDDFCLPDLVIDEWLMYCVTNHLTLFPSYSAVLAPLVQNVSITSVNVCTMSTQISAGKNMSQVLSNSWTSQIITFVIIMVSLKTCLPLFDWVPESNWTIWPKLFKKQLEISIWRIEAGIPRSGQLLIRS